MKIGLGSIGSSGAVAENTVPDMLVGDPSVRESTDFSSLQEVSDDYEIKTVAGLSQLPEGYVLDSWFHQGDEKSTWCVISADYTNETESFYISITQ